MRLWSLHPKYLDAKGLVALWREALLAKKVLQGGTVGYRNHPQLARFRASSAPLAAINCYLQGVWLEAEQRGYRFDCSKIGRFRSPAQISVTAGQIRFEKKHLLAKLLVRDKARHVWFSGLQCTSIHPLFRRIPGRVMEWERV